MLPDHCYSFERMQAGRVRLRVMVCRNQPLPFENSVNLRKRSCTLRHKPGDAGSLVALAAMTILDATHGLWNLPFSGLSMTLILPRVMRDRQTKGADEMFRLQGN